MKKNKNIPSNFKNYIAFLKIWKDKENRDFNNCLVCGNQRNLKDETCYKCYKKQYNKKIDYQRMDRVEDFKKKQVVKTKNILYPSIGFLAGSAIVAASTLSIALPLMLRKTKTVSNDVGDTSGILFNSLKEKTAVIMPEENIDGTEAPIQIKSLEKLKELWNVSLFDKDLLEKYDLYYENPRIIKDGVYSLKLILKAKGTNKIVEEVNITLHVRNFNFVKIKRILNGDDFLGDHKMYDRLQKLFVSKIKKEDLVKHLIKELATLIDDLNSGDIEKAFEEYEFLLKEIDDIMGVVDLEITHKSGSKKLIHYTSEKTYENDFIRLLENLSNNYFNTNMGKKNSSEIVVDDVSSLISKYISSHEHEEERKHFITTLLPNLKINEFNNETTPKKVFFTVEYKSFKKKFTINTELSQMIAESIEELRKIAPTQKLITKTIDPIKEKDEYEKILSDSILNIKKSTSPEELKINYSVEEKKVNEARFNYDKAIRAANFKYLGENITFKERSVRRGEIGPIWPNILKSREAYYVIKVNGKSHMFLVNGKNSILPSGFGIEITYNQIEEDGTTYIDYVIYDEGEGIDLMSVDYKIIGKAKLTGFKTKEDSEKIKDVYHRQIANKKEIPLRQFENKIIPHGFTIPSSVTKIGVSAFKNAQIPTGFIIPDSVAEISPSAFEGAKLPENFVIPNTVRIIGSGAFSSSTIKKGFKLPDHLLKIEQMLFSRAKLPSDFTIPDSVQKIGGSAFSYTKIPEKFKLPKSLNEIGENAFQKAGIPQNFVIPNSVTKLGQGAFIKAIISEGFKLPDGLLSLSRYLFSGASLPKNFVLPSSVITVGDSAFKSAIIKEGFKLPSGIRVLDKESFYKVTLPKGFRLPNGLTQISDGAFEKAVLSENFIIPDSVLSIGVAAFAEATITSGFRLPNGIEEISQALFSKAKGLPDDFTIPNSVKIISEFAFRGVTIPEGFAIPSNVKEIEKYAFGFTTLPTNFKIPSTVTKLSKEAFKSATLPKGYIWFDKNNNKIKIPTAGSYVGKKPDDPNEN